MPAERFELPHHDEAEKATLGGLVVKPELVATVADKLTPKHFYRNANRVIYEAILSLYGRGEQIDLVTVKYEIGAALEEIGGAVYLGSLVDGIPHYSSVDHWVGLILREAQRRAAVNLGRRLADRALEDGADPGAVLSEHSALVQKAAEIAGGGPITTMRDATMRAIRNLDEFVKTPSGVIGIPTGFPKLDRISRGMRNGTLWIIGGRPGRGKSSLLGQIALTAAKAGKRVLMFAMEMPDEDVAERMLLGEAGADPWELRQDTDGSEWAKLARVVPGLAALPIKFDSRETPTIEQIRATARQEHARGLDLVVVDYLQRLTVDAKVDRWLAIGMAAQGLKSLSRALRIPVIAACQLTANSEEDRPTMAHLAQARQIIAAEADLIAFLHPMDLEGWKTQDFPAMHLYVDKQRKGPTAEILLSFDKARSWFAEQEQPQS